MDNSTNISLLQPQAHAPTSGQFARQPLHVMVKPIGPICNLDCEYCYYLHKEDLYPATTSWRMPGETLETFIRQYVEAQPANASEITFAWQGGEPTLLGLDFFRRVVELQQRFSQRRQKIVNALQTNGVLLDDDWAKFFREHGFLIGISIDGPAELHDRYRYDKKGRPTFRAVLKAIQLLQRQSVEFNALVVVNRHNGDHGRRVYTYLRDNGVQFMQFIPIVERRGVGVHGEPLKSVPQAPVAGDPADRGTEWDHLVSTRSVRPHQFGDFLISVFDEWLRRDVGKVFVQIFDQALAAWLGLEPSLCLFRKQCGRALAMEHNGDLYSCDHFVEPDYLLGNIHELPIVELANSPRQRAFAAAKENSLPQYCRECEVQFACNGECPKNRFIETPTAEAGLNYLCAGYRKFFNHVRPAMELMAQEVRAGRPAAAVMPLLRTSGTKRRRTCSRPHPADETGRNDPCPCGSGRKFKRCCGEKR